METMLILLGAVGVLALLAERFRFPFPIMMVIGGIVLAVTPELPTVSMDPKLVLVVFLPPLIYSAAFFFPWDEFRANLTPILMMAIGLVLVTMLGVALVSHWLIPGLTLGAGFVLGAVVSPPDAVAANAVLHRLRVRQRMITILEGESLVNDAIGLVAYSFAVAAVVTGAFSPTEAALDFVWVSIGGVGFGLIVGWIVTRLHERIENNSTGMTLEILAPYLAYAPADHFGVSGVLAAVAAGMYVGNNAINVLNPQARMQGETIWGFINYFLNGAIFILIGLQFPMIMKELEHYPWWKLALYGTLVSAVVIALRFLWVMQLPRLVRRFLPRVAARFGKIQKGALVVVSWAGMRGAVSLAAALAIPNLTASGEDFPGQELIIFLTYCVITTTLILPSLTLPWLIRRLGVGLKGNAYEVEMQARVNLLQDIVELVNEEEMKKTPALSESSIRVIREHFETRYEHLRVLTAKGDKSGRDIEAELRFFRRLIAHGRNRLGEMRREGFINEEVRRKLTHELDAEEVRIEQTLWQG